MTEDIWPLIYNSDNNECITNGTSLVVGYKTLSYSVTVTLLGLATACISATADPYTVKLLYCRIKSYTSDSD